MIGHDDKGIQLKSAFTTLVLQVIQHQVRGSCDLENAAALRGNERQKVRSGFLCCSAHGTTSIVEGRG